MDNALYEQFEANPIIAAIKDDSGLDQVLSSDISIVFILYGDILNICHIVEKLKNAGKTTFVHVDLVSGFGPREIIVDYIKKETKADGIISTRSGMIRRAKELGMCGILRIFMIDSMALESVVRQQTASGADIVEVLPGVLPKVISWIVKTGKTHVIAGGLLRDKEDVVEALKAGAIAVSTTNTKIWFI